jgi:hypothetical protein
MQPIKIPGGTKVRKGFIKVQGLDHLGSVQVDVSGPIGESDAI